MWIYDQNVPETALVPTVPSEADAAPKLEIPGTEDAHEFAIYPADRPFVPKKRNRRFSFADCWTLAIAFLLGSAASGVLCALCAEAKTEWLSCYVRQWIETFSISETHTAAAVFAIEYGTLVGAATILVLFGFSAFGPVLIFLFTMLYGVGNGLLLSQLFLGTSWNSRFLIFVLASIPASTASACLCLLGAAALRVSCKIRAYSFLPVTSSLCHPNTGALIEQYLLTIVLLFPMCGIAAGFTCMGNRLL